MPEYDPPNAFYTEIAFPSHINPCAFIGKEGCHLKRMTELSGCDYLWYDFNRNVIEVWGREHKLPKAVRMLKKRIGNFVEPPLAPLAPPEFISDVVSISQKDDTYIVTYTIEGPDNDCIKFYLENILSKYPSAGYGTNIVKKEPGKLTVRRGTSCD